jgi:hypothetical protein
MIYGWRGAEITNWQQFKAIHKQCKEVQLVRNFRSGSVIVEVRAACRLLASVCEFHMLSHVHLSRFPTS